jgi:hypothetical protein
MKGFFSNSSEIFVLGQEGVIINWALMTGLLTEPGLKFLNVKILTGLTTQEH